MVLDTAKLLSPKTSAPALSRGLAVLATLGERSPCSLEALSSELSLPKASTLRLLDTLEAIGLIHRRPDKRYAPLWELQPVGDTRANFRQVLQRRMDDLCRKLGQTIEWYEAADDGMQLVLQSIPQTEVAVRARPGFIRDWSKEFEAVTRLGVAFAKQAPRVNTSTAYLANGQLQTLSKEQIQAQLASAESKKQAFDKAYNTNGVRRLAVAVFDSSDTFMGVLALAEVFRFGKRPSSTSLLNQLQSIIP